MTIQLIIDNVTIPVRVVNFSDGASSVKLEVPDGFNPSRYYSISVDPTTGADHYLWQIALVNDAINNLWGWGKFTHSCLRLAYLPYGRADRVFEKGNPHPLDIFLQAIQHMFDVVYLTDPHSEYYLKYSPYTEFVVKSQHQCFIETVGNDIKSGDVLIAPDKGALNKIYKLQQALDVRTIATFVVEAGKKRDIETGRVLETTLPEGTDPKGKTAWIVDDLCDGGGTFLPLALKLKEAGAKQVNLYVTHMIAPKGLNHFRGLINKLYVYQTVAGYINRIDIDNFNKGI